VIITHAINYISEIVADILKEDFQKITRVAKGSTDSHFIGQILYITANEKHFGIMTSLNMHVMSSNFQERQLHRTRKHQKSSEKCALLGHYAAGSGKYLATLRENLSFPSCRAKNPIILGPPHYPISSGCPPSTLYTRRKHAFLIPLFCSVSRQSWPP
jgi:hypothetical protein